MREGKRTPKAALRLVHPPSERQRRQPTRREMLADQLNDVAAELTEGELEEAVLLLKAMITERG